ncbi:RDD family protein [Photobacterium sanguinicancri]|uniref:RDD family protein n=1 Tax=Photobacterium sanguinicancri TaxID=875932 RepID=UPI003D12A4F8
MKKKQQNVQPSKEYATLLRRLGAWFYDVLIVAAVLMLAGGIAMALIAGLLQLGILDISGYEDASAYLGKHPVAGMLYSGYLAAVVIAFYAFFWCKAGQTLGMRAWKLRLQNSDGSNIRLTQAFIRMATSAFGLGNFIALFSKKKQSFQDIMAECEMIITPKIR